MDYSGAIFGFELCVKINLTAILIKLVLCRNVCLRLTADKLKAIIDNRNRTPAH